MCSEGRQVRLRMNHPGPQQILRGGGVGGIGPLRQFFTPRISTSTSLGHPHYLSLARVGEAGGGEILCYIIK